MISLQKSVPNWIKKFQSKKHGSCKIYLNSGIPNSFLISPTNTQEISDLINSLDDSKASGPIKMLKLARHKLSIPLNDICITSFNEGIFSEKNKVGKVVPSHKKGPTNDVNNYRPISLLSVFSKLLEKLMVVKDLP